GCNSAPGSVLSVLSTWAQHAQHRETQLDPFQVAPEGLFRHARSVIFLVSLGQFVLGDVWFSSDFRQRPSPKTGLAGSLPSHLSAFRGCLLRPHLLPNAPDVFATFRIREQQPYR